MSISIRDAARRVIEAFFTLCPPQPHTLMVNINERIPAITRPTVVCSEAERDCQSLPAMLYASARFSRLLYLWRYGGEAAWYLQEVGSGKIWNACARSSSQVELPLIN